MDITKLKAKPIVSALFFLFVLFCLSGGPQVVNGFLNGYRSVRDARFGVSAPFYAGFLVTGFFGLLYAFNNFKVRSRCLLGFGVLLFSFLCIEVLYAAVVGR